MLRWLSVLLVVGALLLPREVRACVEVLFPKASLAFDAGRASAVVRGRALSSTLVDRYVWVTRFRVEMWLKGDGPQLVELTGSAPFRTDRDALVFVNRANYGCYGGYVEWANEHGRALRLVGRDGRGILYLPLPEGPDVVIPHDRSDYSEFDGGRELSLRRLLAIVQDGFDAARSPPTHLRFRF